MYNLEDLKSLPLREQREMISVLKTSVWNVQTEGMRLSASIDITNMSKEDIIRKTWDLPELPDSLMDLLNQRGFVTGSSLFLDDIDEANDIDICISIPAYVFEGFALIKDIPDYADSNDFEGFRAIYVHHKNKLYNILCISDYSLFNAWFKTTEALKQLKPFLYEGLYGDQEVLMSDILKVKWKRVRLFRALRDVFFDASSLYEELPIEEAHKYNKCCKCGQEAIYFMDRTTKQRYTETGICERCQ